MQEFVLAASVGLVAAVPPGVIAFLSWQESKSNKARIQEVHLTMNSRLDQLLELTRTSSYNAGRVAGVIAGTESSASAAAAADAHLS